MEKKFTLAFFRKAGEEGGKIGAARRHDALSSAERKRIAKKAAEARWGKKKDSVG